MKRIIALLSLWTLLAGLSGVSAFAQAASSVKGTAKDENGKPITDAVVEFDNIDKGTKQTAKVNNKGEYYIMGIMPGKYKAQLLKNGQPIDVLPIQIPSGLGGEYPLNFDLAKDLTQGLTAEQKKKIEEIKAQNKKVEGLNTTLAQARDLEKAGNYDQAVSILQPVAEQNPNEDLVWAYLGDAYKGAKKYPEAVDAYQKAVQLKPTSGGYLSGLADAYGKAGQTDKAIEQYDAAAKAEPANAATYYFNEGAVLTNTGKIDEAIAAFDKVIAADPNRADAYYWKGVNLMGKATTGKDGKFVAAPGTAEAFQKYLELKPDGSNADAAKQMLASIGASIETSYGKPKTTSKSGKKQ
jgi:tetratricopeptide (TPR) repeat protein